MAVRGSRYALCSSCRPSGFSRDWWSVRRPVSALLGCAGCIRQEGITSGLKRCLLRCPPCALCVQSHFDDADRFVQPIYSLRLFSDSRLSFGTQLYGCEDAHSWWEGPLSRQPTCCRQPAPSALTPSTVCGHMLRPVLDSKNRRMPPDATCVAVAGYAQWPPWCWTQVHEWCILHSHAARVRDGDGAWRVRSQRGQALRAAHGHDRCEVFLGGEGRPFE